MLAMVRHQHHYDGAAMLLMTNCGKFGKTSFGKTSFSEVEQQEADLDLVVPELTEETEAPTQEDIAEDFDEPDTQALAAGPQLQTDWREEQAPDPDPPEDFESSSEEEKDDDEDDEGWFVSDELMEPSGVLEKHSFVHVVPAPMFDPEKVLRRCRSEPSFF
eukprot:TRINITY_DN13037_c0_g1_i1.p1 TRINITY_DN13037_c0_g1~~TRINITY_DN13037_c0_g1_i1.p1  ORF type:complete len:161 (-),score=38.22 TRINITY_DN13037_c0_g1_i1:36-518(-)